MFATENDWIAVTTDPLDFCPECRMHLTKCECDDPLRCRYEDCLHPLANESEQITCPACRDSLDLPPLVSDVVLSDMSGVDPCLYCGKAFATYRFNPYCSPECSARADGESHD